MDLLIPTWLDLAGWAGVLAAGLALTGLGRLLSAGRMPPEAALVAGWGGAVLVLTAWGVSTPLSLRLPGVALVAAGAIGLAVPRSRLCRAEWRSVAQLGLLALPLLLVMASARPSLPDTFLNLLPNAAYLYDHGEFPADARPPAHSFLPGAPYNLQLAAFIASLGAPQFPPNAMIGLNLLLQLAAALLLARLAAGSEDRRESVPPWGATALGLLLATAFNPGFVPRYDLSDYSEPSVAVALAFAGWFAARFLDPSSAEQERNRDLWAMALSLAALVNIKQDSVALAAGLLAAAGFLVAAVPAAGRPGSSDKRSMFVRLSVAALPAVLAYGAWRWYVLSHFVEGELKPLPFAQWQFGALPLILRRMLGVIAEKAFLFGAFGIVFVALIARLRRHRHDLATVASGLLAGVFIVYNAALMAAYMGHFPGTIGTDAHSYYRYNTHLSLLLMVALVLLVRAAARERGWRLDGAWRRFIPTGLVVLTLALPFFLGGYLRFDLEVPQLRAWTLAQAAAGGLQDHDRVALVLPGDNGSVSAMLEGLLRMMPPRRPGLDVSPVEELTPATLADLDRDGIRLAILSCAPPGPWPELARGSPGVPPGGGALLRRDDSGWHAVTTWSYPPVPDGARWSQVLSAAPLCLGGAAAR